ncbi:uncharacterized protein LOC115214103 [Octopus sinensis]|uniref:Uncharacterized protein LOC115214103 n=1 Tax=Octopus sinensis TaxID=2607531 RepID=A0A6P7SM48_9MOLL|nr:uncharacterized protein LOC115214103 [Octopus sinensis]XP_036360598.1 uncharacterized protein LOC115214103 [Octopus sinensis]
MNRLRKDLKVASILSAPEEHRWSAQTYTLQELVSKFTLPRVVICAAESCYLNEMEFEFDLKQPLLIFNFREIRKLQTKCLEYNESEESYTENGPDVIIPEDYDGWFYCPDCDEDCPPPYYEDAQAVSDARAKAVITMKETLAIHQPESSIQSGKDFYEERPVEPGRVLRVLNSDVVKGKHLKQLKQYQNKTRFLKCFSESKDILLIPFSSNTGFCELPLDGPDSKKYLTMKNIIEREDFPFRLNLVCGNLPPILDTFVGVVTAKRVIKECTVLASTLSSSDPLLLELKLDSPVRFSLALNNLDLQQRDDYLEALHVCNSEGESYLQNMKVAFQVYPDVSNLSEDNKDCEENSSITRTDSIGLFSEISDEFSVENWEQDKKDNSLPSNLATEKELKSAPHSETFV